MTVDVRVGPEFPLGRRVLVRFDDGAKVDAAEWEQYRSHCRDMLTTTLDERAEHFELCVDEYRYSANGSSLYVFAHLDVLLNPGHFVEMQEAVGVLMRQPKATADYARGVAIKRAIDRARSHFRHGERGEGPPARNRNRKRLGPT